ncbi:MAG: DUF5666 domain-containing protein [Chloroflexota bacterium]|nr:DUF5666 domain-containing protein [Chloroflexota bacterium]
MRQKVTVAALGLMAVLTLAVVGIGAASAQSGTTQADTAYTRFIGRVAELLGKQPAEVKSAMTQASKEQIDQAVKDGNLTKAQADDIKAKIDETGRPFPMFGPRGGFGHHDGIRGTVIRVSGSTLTVKTGGGNRTVKLTSDTEIRNNGEAAKASAIKVGTEVAVIGSADSNRVVTARAVLIGMPDGPGFRGGHHHGFREGPWGEDPDNADGSSGSSTVGSSGTQ